MKRRLEMVIRPQGRRITKSNRRVDISADTQLVVDWNPVGPPTLLHNKKIKGRWRVPTVETARALSPCFRGFRCWVSGIVKRQSSISRALIRGPLRATL
jgi:hypothetical protein